MDSCDHAWNTWLRFWGSNAYLWGVEYEDYLISWDSEVGTLRLKWLVINKSCDLTSAFEVGECVRDQIGNLISLTFIWIIIRLAASELQCNAGIWCEVPVSKKEKYTAILYLLIFSGGYASISHPPPATPFDYTQEGATLALHHKDHYKPPPEPQI